MNQNKKYAICYDFDGTLSPKYMYEYSMLPQLGYNSINEVFELIKEKSVEQNLNELMLSFYSIMIAIKEKNIVMNDEYLQECGKAIEFYEGVLTWFDRINKFAKENGIEVEHFVISSGNEEIVKGCAIAKEFKQVFGSKYMKDKNGVAIHMGNLLSPFDKISYAHRISCGIFHHGSYKKQIGTYIPMENMIYIGDGETDIPCMREIISCGGNAVMVYNPEKENAKAEGVDFCKAAGTSHFATTDYSENGELEKIVKNLLIK